jgi:hypothetical protein
VSTVQACWPAWQSHIRTLAGTTPTPTTLLQTLGSNLGQVFKQTSTGKTQSSQSGAGSAWEALICWYLNLCLVGTRSVVIKKASHWPAPIRDALTVTYGTVKTNTESDLIAVTFPADATLDAYSSRYTGKARSSLDAHIATLLGQIELCVIQCKTNWNENAQIPMMWDMIYSAKGFHASRAAIGLHGNSVNSLARFAYAFVTLPSNKTAFTRDSMPVLRCSNLSGGNFWGRPASNGVAGSIADIFQKNFATGTQHLGQPWPNHLANELAHLSSKYAYFDY